MNKRLWSVLLTLCLLFGMCAYSENASSGCWYEIFVYSYSDSDGDGTGDLRGVINKLDYIEYMGYEGIWLMPVMPSPSYHKYDVTDYMNVDPLYGTLDDMRSLVSECHERGIRVIIDLPVNHTSTRHKWFELASTALKFGNPDNKYVSYYNFSKTAGAGYVRLQGTSWYYEEQFAGGGMPDLNLDNAEVRSEIQRILEFWLCDVDVDGFRLDAVTSYYSTLEGDVEFLAWLNAESEALKPGCYIVGEAWTSLSQIQKYYESGIDSFFLFPASQAEGYIVSAINSKSPGQKYMNYLLTTESTLKKGIIAPFLCNHDTGRAIGLLQARSNPAKAKFGEALLNLFPGYTFTYYGDEIGMAGSGADPNKRIGMYWTDGEVTLPPPGADQLDYPYPCVYEQIANEDSLLNYCRAINLLKAEFPVISAGRTRELLTEKAYCVFERFTNDASVVIAINFSSSGIAQAMLCGEYALAGELETGSEAVAVSVIDGTTGITLPPYAVAVLVPVN
ncbi:MAG: alpha-amylase [Clostridia bacterium]|nr:alpha-amylase [Clostridia bacterium]